MPVFVALSPGEIQVEAFESPALHHQVGTGLADGRGYPNWAMALKRYSETERKP
jgi:hypothetical protein